MAIDNGVIEALNGLLKIIIYSLYVASPLIILILLMTGYEKYKKWKTKEEKEADRIIVKMNEQITKDALACDTLTNQKTQLRIEVESLEKHKRELQQEVGAVEETKVPEQTDIKDLNVKDLQKLAKAQGVKRYSKLKKTELLKALGA